MGPEQKMKKDEISEGLAEADHAGSSEITLNNAGTCAKGDTPLTQARSTVVHGWTYFVRDGDAIKIGSSIRPQKRVEAIQTGSPRTIELLAIVPQSVADEFTTHQKFAHLRSRGEWFRAEPDLLDYIEHLIRAMASAAPVPAPVAPIRKPAAGSTTAHVIQSRLLSRRNRVGAETREGRILSNLIKQTAALQTYERPAWATHPMQTLQGMMEWQMKLLN